ncbi:recQ mediated genome instability 1 isoform X1 [Bombyx mori]|uniref:recQ mediated genome instability 1 isoform X1 n=1 Tax=Bombyx mori TaxID=7091 RepID=UPI002ED2F2FF
MSSTNLLAKVRSHFATNYMNAVDEWLEDCVEYLRAIHGDDVNKIQEEAKQQWLLNDLEEVCTGSLPKNISQEHNKILNGVYLLQIKSVQDIGTPAYQQYLELHKVNMENVEATTRQEDKRANHRMLKLQLTDGDQELFAIEYEPIRCLHSNMALQSKLLIKGPVTCRRGHLLLTAGCTGPPPARTHETRDAFECNVQRAALPDPAEGPPAPRAAPPSDHTKRPLPETIQNPEKRLKVDYDDEDFMAAEDEDHLREVEVGCDALLHKHQCVVPGEPYVYIKQIVELPEADRAGRVFTVKALIIKLLQKLTVGRDGWSLRCTLVDGSGALDLEFASDVFSELIGLSPHQMYRLKKEMGSRPDLRDKLDKRRVGQARTETDAPQRRVRFPGATEG